MSALIGIGVALAVNLIGNWIIWRSVKARGHWIVTVGGPESGKNEWVPGKRRAR